jgi:hypothetical protein
MVATANKKTFYSYLADKVWLRARNIPKGEVNVLDCFAGKGTIWRAVQLVTGREINTLPIDTTNSDGFFYLPGDNRSFLSIIDLSRFNVVDLDAYGSPYDQLKILFDRGYKGSVFVTHISFDFGSTHLAMLKEIGFPNEMVNKIHSLFQKNGWEYFKEYLALHGVKTIRVRSHQRKHYLFFKMG